MVRSELTADASLAAMRARSKDRKSTRLNSSHMSISYAVFRLKKNEPAFARILTFAHVFSAPTLTQVPPFLRIPHRRIIPPFVIALQPTGSRVRLLQVRRPIGI